MNRSTIKTWFKRNGFKVKYGAFRREWKYCYKGGRHYRIRNNEKGASGFVVDTSDLDFDRWANSTEIHAQPIAEFITCFCKISVETKEILSGEPHH